MNITKIAKYLKLRRELTEEEFHYAEFLGGLTETERTTLSELIQPEKPVKAKPKTTRKIEKCAACNYTRRAIHHQEPTHRDYHQFDDGKSDGSSASERKSKRAESLAGVIAGTASGNSKLDLCAYESHGKVCKGDKNDGIHDPAMGYGGYHEFQSAESAQAATGDR